MGESAKCLLLPKQADEDLFWPFLSERPVKTRDRRVLPGASGESPKPPHPEGQGSHFIF